MKMHRLILVGPKYSGNVGACARVAANYGVTDICVVAPACDIHDEQAQLYGKGPARDYLLNMKIVERLEEALTDCHSAVAITRRKGGRSPVELSFGSLGDWVTAQGPRHRTAWVFGREDNCLTSDEVALCSHFCAIPTSTVMPTLNLSHAVAVVLSRLYCDGVSETSGADDSVETKINKTPLTLGEFEALMKHWEEVAVALDLTRGGDPEKMMIRLRRLLQRARPNVQEAANLRRFLSKVQLKTKKGDDR